MLIRCYIQVPLIHNLISYILHNQIFSLSQHIDKVTRKTGLPHQRCYKCTKFWQGESQDQGVVFFRKQFYQKHVNRSNLKCSRHSKRMTDSKLPFSMLCIIGYKNYPHLWNVKLTPKTIKVSHIQYPTIFWLYQKINNQQMISPLKKKHLHLKKWDEVEFPPS